ncbi:MAG: type II secretion system protein [Parasphingorhabdus sp.]
MSSVPTRNGFTLMEVLVALVACAFLMAVLLDGAVSAKSRSKTLQLQDEALLLADAHIDELKNERGEPASTSGRSNGLTWSLQEEEIARDRRGNLVLVKAVMTVVSADNVELLDMEKRYLKKLLIS